MLRGERPTAVSGTSDPDWLTKRRLSAARASCGRGSTGRIGSDQSARYGPHVASLVRHILPIYVFPKPVAGEEQWPSRFAGTGFVLAPNIFVTCAHCVPDLPDSEIYAVSVPDDPGGRTAHYLRYVTRDPSGADLATAWVDLTEPPPYHLRTEPPMDAIGLDVGTVGYPGTFFELQPAGYRRFEEQPRYFSRGYIARAFHYQPPGGGREIPSYEVDMPAPRGLSGAPLIAIGQPYQGQILGVVHGAHPPFGSQGESDIRLPPYVFALAHYHSTLMALRGTATGDRPLSETLANP